MVTFRRLVGAAGDVRELEYIAALHQTCLPDTRGNGTIGSRDVQRLLVSRYGLLRNLSHAQCRAAVRSLGGGAAQPELRAHRGGSGSRGGAGRWTGAVQAVSSQLAGKRKSDGGISGKSDDGAAGVRDGSTSAANEADDDPLLVVGESSAPVKDDGAAEPQEQMKIVGVVTDEEEDPSAKEPATATTPIADEPPLEDSLNEEEEDQDETNVAEQQKGDDEDAEEKKSGSTFLGDLGAVLTGKQSPSRKNIVETEEDAAEAKPPAIEDQPTGEAPNEEESKNDTDGAKVEQPNVEETSTTKEEASKIENVAVKEEPSVEPALQNQPEAAAADPATLEDSVEIADGSAENMADAGPESHVDDREIPEEYLDLVQVLAILLIPTLARAGQKIQANQVTLNETMEEEDSKRSFDETSQLQQQQQQQKTSLEPQPAHLIEDGLRFLLKNVYIDADDTLDVDLVEALLLEFGEFERAQDRQLLEEMVQAATTASGRLDVASFAQAMTADLREWEIGSEDRMSTYAEDVFGGDPVAAEKEKDPNSRAYEMSAIDYAVDQHTSLLIVGITWTLYFMMSITYGALVQSLVKIPCEERGEGDEFGCQLKGVLWTWFVFALFLSLFGCIVIVPLSLGNSPTNRTPTRMLASCLLSCVYAVIPYAVTIQFIRDAEEPYTAAEERATRRFFLPMLKFTVIVGLFLAFLFLIQLLVLLLFSDCRLKYFTITSNTNGEWRSKRAGTRKLNLLLQNAHSLHSDVVLRPASSIAENTSKTVVDETMLNFTLRGAQFEDAGGILWTWKLLWSGRFFDTEGIWLPTRLLVFQAVQFASAIVLIFIVFNFTNWMNDLAGDFHEDLDPTLPDWVIDLIPTQKAVSAALYPASAVTTFVIVCLVLLYIPSATSTILLYRCGLTPSLGSRYFVKYRNKVDLAYMNTGNAIYGLIGATLLFYFLVGLFIFLFTFELTRGFMIRVVAWGLGLGITVMVKLLLVKTCQTTMYKSFYRTKPRSANLSTLLLECWFLGLGSSVLVGRITQFLCAAVFWVGRIDVPFLSQDVALFGYAFDYVPTNFAKDLLQHEAHRHPYLERLAQMYLMKMHHPGFNSNAGAVWRQLFVVAMMPWMRKHRVFSDVRLAQSIEALARYKLEAEEDAEGFVERLGEDVAGMQQAGWQAGGNVVAEVSGMTKAGAEMGVRFVTSNYDSAEQHTSPPSEKVGSEGASSVNP